CRRKEPALADASVAHFSVWIAGPWRSSLGPRVLAMNILGFSGLDTSVQFKRSWFPSLSEREYRIVQGLDSAAALVRDGRVEFAAAEERFTRCKGTGAFPIGA